MADFTTRTSCRICGSTSLIDLFSLGTQFISDFVAKEDIYKGIRCPIDMVMCKDCTLSQLRHTANQDNLYRHYWYRSNITQSMREALRDITSEIERVVSLDEGDVVVDIGSNVGTLLRSYTTPGLVKVGVEPAKNLAEEGAEGLEVFLNDFWSANSYYAAVREIDPHDMADNARVISAIGMFYDLDDPNKFVADVARVLRRDGIFVVQMMCLRNMLRMGDIGNVCMEHLLYYTMESLKQLFDRHGLEIINCMTVRVNGESTRLHIIHKGVDRHAIGTGSFSWRGNDPYTKEGIKEELEDIDPSTGKKITYFRRNDGLQDDPRLHDPNYLRSWFKEVDRNRRECMDYLKSEHMKGKRIWLLAASTKGSVIAQYYGLDHTIIEGASERTPDKVGKWTSGTGIPIYSEEDARRHNPDILICMPYAFRTEMIEREREYLERGGRIVFCMPKFEVVTKDNLA